MVAAWAGLPVGLVVYLALRYVIHMHLALPLSQVVYMAPPVLATAFCGAAALACQPKTRERLVWTLLCTMAALLSFYEGVLGAYAIDGATPGSALLRATEVAGVFGTAALVAALVVAGRLDLLERKRATRMFIDVVALFALFTSVLYGTWIRRMIADSPAVHASQDAVRYSVYAAAGLTILIAVVIAVVFVDRTRLQTWELAVLAAAGAYAFGVVLWPVTAVADFQSGSPLSDEAMPGIAYFIGYYLLFVAGLLRSRGHNRPSGPYAPGEPVANVWTHMAAVTVVGLSVPWLALAAIGAPKGSPDEAVYLAVVVIASIAVVLRSVAATAEVDEAAAASRRDLLTGMADAESYEIAVAAAVGRARRDGAPVSLILIDLDDFAELNAREGSRTGDRVLVMVARAVQEVCGASATAFRTGGDEFAVLVERVDHQGAEQLASVLGEAVRNAAPAEKVTASIGFASAPRDAGDFESLSWHAERAKMWAKVRGKDRAIGFDMALAGSESVMAISSRLSGAPQMDVARALAAATDARDPSNFYHSRNVAALARLLAEDVGLEREHVSRIEVAALLHDAGKIALPDDMLGRVGAKGTLREAAREHSELGQLLVESLRIEGVASWVRSHHERWDGTGYPDGLAGEDIPIEARMIALADAFDAMASGKRYGSPTSKGAALQEIDQGMGVRFDPVLAERFIDVVARVDALGWSDDWTVA